MKPSKRLALRRDVVVDLAADELRAVAGANSGVTCPRCVTVHYECPSNPITQCTVIYVTRQDTCIC